MNTTEYVTTLAKRAKEASFTIANADTQKKNLALSHIAELLAQYQQEILSANEQDIEQAQINQLDSALIERLYIGEKNILSMIEGLKQVIRLPDPIGEMDDFHYRPSGIQVGKMRVPLGVVAIIYESRPNVTIDAAALCIKSGNACILRGGKEALQTNTIIAKLIHQGLLQAQLPQDSVCFVEITDREAVSILLKLPQYIDVVIPRGGKGLVKRITEEARIPVIKHLDGICHVYIDEYANLQQAQKIAINAKTSRYGTCNTMETLLLHEAIASSVLPELKASFLQHQVELRVCPKIQELLGKEILLATEEDWSTEYLAPILSMKIVKNIQEAIEHINCYGSHHTDSIVTENYSHAQQFLRQVDSASVMVNASTRFADGFEYGLGAEIGISTDKIHARGPVGLEGLTNQKWIVLGSGQIRV